MATCTLMMVSPANKRKVKTVNRMSERIIELEKILSEVCGQHENDCTKCPKQSECNEYCKLIQKNNRK